jgi:hypothetical protein
VHGCSRLSSVAGGSWLRNTVTNLSASAEEVADSYRQMQAVGRQTGR